MNKAQFEIKMVWQQKLIVEVEGLLIYDSNLKFSGRCLRFDSANEKSNKKSCPYKEMQDIFLVI